MTHLRPYRNWQPPPSRAGQHSTPWPPPWVQGPEACPHLGLNYSTWEKGPLHSILSPLGLCSSSPAGSVGGSAGITDSDRRQKPCTCHTLSCLFSPRLPHITLSWEAARHQALSALRSRQGRRHHPDILQAGLLVVLPRVTGAHLASLRPLTSPRQRGASPAKVCLLSTDTSIPIPSSLQYTNNKSRSVVVWILCEVMLSPLLGVFKQGVIICMGGDDSADLCIRSRMGPRDPYGLFQLETFYGP